jgi:hypothetical protein
MGPMGRNLVAATVQVGSPGDLLALLGEGGADGGGGDGGPVVADLDGPGGDVDVDVPAGEGAKGASMVRWQWSQEISGTERVSVVMAAPGEAATL